MDPSEQGANDQALLREALQSDVSAFGALAKRHFGVVFAVALARLRDFDAAEDLTQEVFLRAQIHLQQLGPNGNFPAWVVRIARNLAIDWQRRGQRASRLLPMVPLGERLPDVPDRQAKGVSDAMADREEIEALRRAILGLPADLREVILLHVSEEMTQEQIADRLGMHQATVSRRLQRAVDSLRDSLTPLLREAAPALRPAPSALARTLAIAAVVGAMSTAAKASILAAAPASQLPAPVQAGAAGAIGFIGFLQSLPAIIAGGAKAMGTAKGIAVSAVVVAAIAGGTYHFTASDNPSSSDTPATRWQRAVYPYTSNIHITGPDGVTETTRRLVLEPGRMREERPNGIFIFDRENRPNEYLLIVPDRRMAFHTTLTDPVYPADLMEGLGELYESADLMRRSGVIDGILTDQLRGEGWDVWVRQINGQPIRYVVRGSQGTERVETDFVYGANLDESLFSMTPPEGYQVIERNNISAVPREEELIEGLRAATVLTGGSFPPEISMEWLVQWAEDLQPRIPSMTEAELDRVREAEPLVRQAIRFAEYVKMQRGRWFWYPQGATLESPYPGAYLGYYWLPEMPRIRAIWSDFSIRDGTERETTGTTPEATAHSYFARMRLQDSEETISSLILPIEEALEVRRRMGEIESIEALGSDEIEELTLAGTTRYIRGRMAIGDAIDYEQRFDPPVEFVRLIDPGPYPLPGGGRDDAIRKDVQMEILVNGESRLMDVGDMVRLDGRWYIF